MLFRTRILAREPWKRIDTNMGLSLCWIEKSLFPFFSWIARQRSPSNTRPSVLVALNPYVYADEIAKCEEFASAEFGPCSCLPCPQWISFDHFWSINQESPRTQNISKGPCLTFTSLVATRSLLLLHTGACSKDFKLSSGKFEQEGIGGDSDITTVKRALPRVERWSFRLRHLGSSGSASLHKSRRSLRTRSSASKKTLFPSFSWTFIKFGSLIFEDSSNMAVKLFRQDRGWFLLAVVGW